ncbi:MAG: hypothetical protein NZ952_04455, partial [Candidatus Bathyarchaeota archaeon]|nr:hypothetical protein [Candidatus Bathyarchaeota archaeon]
SLYGIFLLEPEESETFEGYWNYYAFNSLYGIFLLEPEVDFCFFGDFLVILVLFRSDGSIIIYL